jgi:hypothetical protein
MLTTRQGILQDFQKKVIALRKLAQAEEVKYNNAKKIIEKKEIEASAAIVEKEACEKVANKIEELINVE